MSELHVTATISPKAGQAEKVEKILAAFTAWVHAYEPDTLKYQLHKEVGKETPEFIMIEVYKDEAALKAHSNGEKFQETVGQLKELLEKPLAVYISTPVAGFENRDHHTLKM